MPESTLLWRWGGVSQKWMRRHFQLYRREKVRPMRPREERVE